MNDFRSLLYPLGFLASGAFTARFVVQWIQSEMSGESRVSRPFWLLSILGNVLLAAHSILQAQIHVALIQTSNGIIAIRNIDLMKRHPSLTLTKTLFILALSLIATTIVTALTSLLFDGELSWFRIPQLPWQQPKERSATLAFHLIGTMGLILFNCRFWIQWWHSERSGQSTLPAAFWWASLLGALSSGLYFIAIKDPVNLIGPLFGTIPYLRNLFLIYRPGTRS